MVAGFDRWTAELIERFDTMLFGRTAWQFMAAYWPQAATSPETTDPQRAVAAFMNGSRKILFTRSLTDASGWSNSQIAAKDLSETVAAEKAKPGKDMVIFAGAKFAQTALRAGVIDEYWLLTIPMLFGGGSRLFDGASARTKLALIDSRLMDTGAVLSRYRVA